MATWWQDINASIIWDDYPSTLTWSAVDNNPWGYQWGFQLYGNPRNVVASPTSATDALSYVQSMADGNSAWTWDAGALGIAYGPLSYWAGRSGNPIPLEASQVITFNGISTDLNMADRYNSAYVTNNTISASAANAADIIANGEYKLNVTSDLADSLDLQDVANFKLTGHALGVRPISQITVDLDSMNSHGNAATLADVATPSALFLSNFPSIYLPTTINPEKWQARGGTLTFSTNHAEVTLNIVPYAVFYTGTTIWAKVSPSDTWATYLTSTTTWADVA